MDELLGPAAGGPLLPHHDFAHVSGVPALLASPSGCTGATNTASTSAAVTSEGHTGGTSGQPSSDDHAGEAGLPTTDRQTHNVGHLVVTALSSAHLCLCCPR
jgi:hypothetical protein